MLIKTVAAVFISCWVLLVGEKWELQSCLITGSVEPGHLFLCHCGLVVCENVRFTGRSHVWTSELVRG